MFSAAFGYVLRAYFGQLTDCTWRTFFQSTNGWLAFELASHVDKSMTEMCRASVLNVLLEHVRGFSVFCHDCVGYFYISRELIVDVGLICRLQRCVYLRCQLCFSAKNIGSVRVVVDFLKEFTSACGVWLKSRSLLQSCI